MLVLNYGFEIFKLFNSFGMKYLLLWKKIIVKYGLFIKWVIVKKFRGILYYDGLEKE